MDADPRLRIASRWYSRRLPIALLVFSQRFLRVLQDDFSFLAYPTNYLESHPPDRGTKSRQARRRPNEWRSGRKRYCATTRLGVSDRNGRSDGTRTGAYR